MLLRRLLLPLLLLPQAAHQQDRSPKDGVPQVPILRPKPLCFVVLPDTTLRIFKPKAIPPSPRNVLGVLFLISKC
jgi:hypothetical protein